MTEKFDKRLFLKNYLEGKTTEPQRLYAPGWSPERCEAARQRCLQHKPWRFSTGAKTPEGKRKISMNAFKHGRRSLAMRFVTDVLKQVKSL
jgi:hypothetical protein